MAADLAAARSFVDVGAGPGGFAGLVAEEHAALRVIAVEPSASYPEGQGPRGKSRVETLRAHAEALPLDDASVDIALCLTSLRHFADRGRALRELRRVVRGGGALWIVEIDADAGGPRLAAHLRGMPSLSRLVFRLLVQGACPPADHFAAEVARAGWRPGSITYDPEQPFFVMRAT
jgi:ubiquinone/menaquinone biosynthesis C-methylase UbiE